MKGFRKWWHRWILDSLNINPPPFIVVFLFVFASVFSIGFWCAHWIDEIILTNYRIYDVMSDNIGGKSYINSLNELLPVDVVYTWVNGSDPTVFENLKKLEFEKFCSNHVNCFPSSYYALELQTSQTSRTPSHYLKYIQTSEVHKGNISRSFAIYAHDEKAYVSYEDDFSPLNLKLNNTFLTKAYWTSDENVDWSLVWKRAVIIQTERYSLRDDLMKISTLSLNILKSCVISSHFDTYVVDCENESLTLTLMEEIEKYKKKHQFIYPKTWKASLILHFNFDIKEFENRFEDSEELRYSLRSLEKFAPWVRRIFLVTNGQIPYWLNLDHPRIRVITHEQIFQDKSHLPTFSSPAIEAHIHRIPGLSENFIYLNDDILFGKPIWPEDFYSLSSGYKIYLSWSIPECSSGCPGTWINDGYCDRPCNSASCDWDGGDCVDAKNMSDKSSIYDVDDEENMVGESESCSPSCSDSWLADSYCDAACSSSSCGYDAGDCGLEIIKENVFQLPYERSNKENKSLTIPKGMLSAWVDLLPLLGEAKNGTLKGKYTEGPGILTITANTALKAMIFVFKPNSTGVVEVDLTFTNTQSLEEKEDHFRVHYDTKPLYISEVKNDLPDLEPSIKSVSNYSFKEVFPRIMKPSYFNLTLNFTVEQPHAEWMQDLWDSREVKILRDRYANEELTKEGFRSKMHSIVHDLSRFHNKTGPNPRNKTLQLNGLIYKNNSLIYKKLNIIDSTENLHLKNKTIDLNVRKDFYHNRKILSIDSEFGHSNEDDGTFNFFPGNLPWEKNHEGLLIGGRHSSVPKVRTGRKLLDTFGESLIFVNKLYNSAYGFTARKVVAHMPHFINRKIVEDLQQKFKSEFHETSSHKLRQANDMQFGFSYFYYIISETRQRTPGEIFDEFDTDLSGTWSDREIRTFLTRTEDIPLHYNSFNDLSAALRNCSEKVDFKPVPTPMYERYGDSDMPTVSRELIVKCDNALLLQKLQKLSVVSKFHHTQVSDSDVHFKMISSNVSSAVYHFDEIRKLQKKFICVNNNLDPKSDENNLVHALAQDLFESLYPIQSSFELSPNYRNRFSYMWQLEEWKSWKNLIRSLIYAFLSCLILITVTAFFGTEIEAMKRRWCKRRRRNDELTFARV